MLRGSIAHEMPAERTALDIHIAVADFLLAIQAAQTPDEALRIHQLIAEGRAALDAMESAALNRADALCGRT